MGIVRNGHEFHEPGFRVTARTFVVSKIAEHVDFTPAALPNLCVFLPRAECVEDLNYKWM